MAILPDLQSDWIAVALAAIFLYAVAVVVHRLFFSPLSKFPGPKLAAATILYEVYYDVIQQGQYTFKIKELHEKYGPIIRIGPNELHVNDPDFYATLYSHTGLRNKYAYFVDCFGLPGAVFSTVDHYQHKRRRQPLNPFFSKQSILRLEPTISSMIEKLCGRIDEFKKSGQPMPTRLAYSCMSVDIITLYSFNTHSNHLDDPDLSAKWTDTINAVTAMGTIMKQMPWAYKLLDMVPDSFVAALAPDMGLVLDWQNGLRRQVRQAIDDNIAGVEKDDGLPRTIFQSLLNSDLPASDKTVERLRQEGQLVVGAGSDTVANTLTVTTFHILDNPEKLAKLVAELEKAIPDPNEPAKLSVVEQLPYLSGIIQEGLRLSYGISTRLQRIAPDEVLQFRDWTIPAGTPVGMTSYMMHHDESIFPDSHSFIPERWIGQPSLDRYLVAFSKGSRSCVGINLAKAELFLTLATVFRRYKIELFDTIRERDVDLKHDHFLPYPSNESKGVRAIFK